MIRALLLGFAGVAMLYLGDAARADRFLVGMVVGAGLTSFLLGAAVVAG